MTIKNINILKQTLEVIFYFSCYQFITILILSLRGLNFFNTYGVSDIDTDSRLWHYWAANFSEANNFNFNYNFHFVSFPYGYDLSYISTLDSTIYQLIINIVKILGVSWHNLLLVSNLSVLISYPLTGIFTFLLIKYLIKDKGIAFISSFVFTFSYYYILDGAGSLSLNHYFLIPLFFLGLIKFIEDKSITKLIISGIIFSVLFKANPYWAFFSGIFTLPLIIYYGKFSLSFTVKYYIFTFIILITTNLNYINSQIYNFNSSSLNLTGKIETASEQLKSIFWLIAPSQYHIYHTFDTKAHTFLGFTALIFGFIGIFINHKNKKNLVFILCFLISILLMSNINFFNYINEIYFHIFRMFRAITRINIFASFFLSIAVAFTLKKLFYLNKFKYFFLFLIGILFILEGLNKDPMWYAQTDFRNIEKLYLPIKNNSKINYIIGYPLESVDLSPRWQLLGQIIHEKPLASGASPFMPEVVEYNNKVKNINDPNTIDVLKEHGIDTIIIYNNLISDKSIIDKLNKDKRLKFVGNYTSPIDMSNSSSINSRSRDINVYLIKNAAKIETTPIIISSNQSLSYNFIKSNPYTYIISLHNDPNKLSIKLNEPFSKSWRIYYGEKINPILTIFKKNSDFKSQHLKIWPNRNQWILEMFNYKKNSENFKDISNYKTITIFNSSKFIEDVFQIISFIAFGTLVLISVKIGNKKI